MERHTTKSTLLFFHFSVVFFEIILNQYIFDETNIMTSENQKSIPFPKKDFPKILRSNTYQSVKDSHSELRKFYNSKNPECLPLNSTIGFCKSSCKAAPLKLPLKKKAVTSNEWKEFE